MPSSWRSSSTDVRGMPCSPPVVSRMSLASARALPRREPLPTTIATSSLSPRPAAPSRSSFSRGRSCSGQGFHGQAILRLMSRRARRRVCRGTSLFAVSFALAAPRRRPAKWIRRRARSTPHEPQAPIATPPSNTRPPSRRCKSAQDAVAQRDYRLALNYALDSRDRAQRAAKEAASQQAMLRSARGTPARAK